MTSLADEYRSTLSAPESTTLSGVDQWLDGFISRRKNKTVLAKLTEQSEIILQLAENLRSLDEHQLQQHIMQTRHQIRCGKNDPNTIQNAFSVMVEIASRSIEKRPYSVQITGALALHLGYAAQMLPGEGKTITAALAASVAAWRGRPCHVITSNDYLAARDAELMKPIFERCCLTVASIVADMQDDDRRRAYQCDLVYATSKELLADYLRDQMRLQGINTAERRLIKALAAPHNTQPQNTNDNLVMRGLFTAIVDEADSVLIDDAVTPLIISVSGQNRLLKEASIAAREIVNRLVEGEHYLVEQRYKNVRLTESAQTFIESILDDLPKLWRGPARRMDLLRQALVAREFYQRDRHYIVDDDKVIIVDEKTGRAMPGRSWSYGLHQAIEAKEQLPLSDPTETHARLSFQRFFRRYQNLSGMSGTLNGIEKELWTIYRLPIVIIPPYRTSRRQDLADNIFINVQQKWQAVVAEITQLHKTSRPVLVGTRSIEESQQLADILRSQNLPCQVLNAHHHKQEAEIIQFAGYPGKITIATNMAGRGTDILLTDEIANLGGLHVIATERHESARVDWQLFGRCGRQGQPGFAQAFISLEDELFKQGLPQIYMRFLKRNFNRSWVKQCIPLIVKLLQKRAETKAAGIRKRLLESEISLKDSLSFLGQ